MPAPDEAYWTPSGFAFASELSTRIVLSDDFDITGLTGPISALDVQSEVRQLQVAVHNWEGLSRRERLTVSLDGGVVRSVAPVQKRLIISLQFVVESDTRDTATVAFNPRTLGLIGAIELYVVGEFAGLHEPGIVRLVPTPATLAMPFQECLSVLRQHHKPRRRVSDDGRLAIGEARLDQVP